MAMGPWKGASPELRCAVSIREHGGVDEDTRGSRDCWVLGQTQHQGIHFLCSLFALLGCLQKASAPSVACIWPWHLIPMRQS